MAQELQEHVSLTKAVQEDIEGEYLRKILKLFNNKCKETTLRKILKENT